MENKLVYLDYAATTPLREEAKQAMLEVMNGPFGNPSSTHSFGRKSRSIVEQCRKYIAKVLHCSAGEIIFTSGGTEADNASLLLPVRDLGITQIITSRIEHHAILHTVEQLMRTQNINITYVDTDEKGNVSLAHLERLLAEGQPTLVSLMHVNNEVGNVLDLKTTGALCKKYGALFHSDTVQSMGHLDIDLSEINIDFLSASAHKFYGPKGVGFMFARSNRKIGSYITGGAQERNLRGGTENIISIAGMHAALQATLENAQEERAHLSQLKNYFKKALQGLPTAVVFNGNSGGEFMAINKILSVGFPNLPANSMFLFNLDLKGIAVSGGSACASGSLKGSHVIDAILPGIQYPVVRFSFGKNTTTQELDYVLSVLKEMISFK